MKKRQQSGTAERAQYLIPPRLVLAGESFQRVSDLVLRPRKPAKALRDLMSGKGTRKRR